jgi:hypothetical protein
MMKICSIEGCGAEARGGKGMCGKHYTTWKRYGDPLTPLRYRAPIGAPQAYYRDTVLPYDGDDCLIWPFAHDTNGAARMRGDDGRLVQVARVLCEEIHGPPPTANHLAIHSCGNGDRSCVTKNHLSWETPAGPTAWVKGENHPRAKLSDQAVREIIAKRGQFLQREIAEQYDTTVFTVCRIQNGKHRPQNLFPDRREQV